MSQLDTLWDLQTIIFQLADREKQMSVKPESFAEVDREYHEAIAEMAWLEQQLEVMNKERRLVDGELADQQELLKKYQGTLMQVKNQQQYAAAWKEIDATRKHVKDLEDSVLKSMSESEGIQSQVDARDAGHDELKGRWDKAHAEWQSSLSDLRREAEKLKKQAHAIEEKIPKALRDEFHKLFRQRQGVAVVRVMNDSCTACRSRVRPALTQQLKRGDLIRCEGCHRILFLEKSMEKSAESPSS